MQVPAPFHYERAESVDHALTLLQQWGEDARIIAGGHSLLPMLKLRLAHFDHLIDINGLHADLGYIRVGENQVSIGAMTRHHELAESVELRSLFPIIAEAEQVIADPIVRNRGTIGGSLAQADPAEDLSAVCSTLNATCVVRGPDGTRELTMAEFHVGPYETALAPTEILTEIRIPVRPHGGSAYYKVERRAGDWASGAAGAAVWMDGDRIADARIGLVAVGAEPAALTAVSDTLRGQEPSPELFAQAGKQAAQQCEPWADQRGSVEYKKHLADVLTQRALAKAAARAVGADLMTATV